MTGSASRERLPLDDGSGRQGPRSTSRLQPMERDTGARPGAPDLWTPERASSCFSSCGWSLTCSVPRGTCDPTPGSDASSTRDDTPSAAAVEHVLWARRHREARPAGATVAGSTVTGATQRLSMSWRSCPLGHSLGRTLPYWAVSGLTLDTHGRNGMLEFAGISSPGCPANAMLHTREVAGSKPAAPMREVPLAGTFWQPPVSGAARSTP